MDLGEFEYCCVYRLACILPSRHRLDKGKGCCFQIQLLVGVKYKTGSFLIKKFVASDDRR